MGDSGHKSGPIVQPPGHSGQGTVITNNPVIDVLLNTERQSKGNFDALAATIRSTSQSAQQSLDALFAHLTSGMPLTENWLTDFWFGM